MRSVRELGLGLLPVCFLSVVCLSVATPAQAQEAGNGFLFRAPTGEVSFRGGFDRASAGSDVFAFTVKQLTLSQRDFSGLTFATDVDKVLTPRLDVRFSVGVSKSTTPSEFRDFVDNNRRPIQQTTEYMRVPLTASVKAYLSNPGRSIGRFAWIPSRFAPYAGGGGGAMWYRFRQQGDFIDFATSKVFPDIFVSDGWTPTVQAFVGTDASLSPRFAVTAEGRYQWARSRLSTDFSQFDPIDLSGFAVTAGFSIRY
jgi:hypothetical protein